MPTISAHVDEEMAQTVESAAKASPQKKVGPYITEAVMQRLSREGMLPGNPHAQLIAVAEDIGVEKSLAVLAQTARPADARLVHLAEEIGIDESIRRLAKHKREVAASKRPLRTKRAA
jgi:hypothetical protein